MTLTPQLAQQCLELIDFLHGSAPLDGVWFGDKHPTERGAFWWRKRLSALRESLASGEGDDWMPIETAPKGSGEHGPELVTDPAYVEPPRLLLFTDEGIIIGYYDWYYHPGYGRGAEPGVSAWRDIGGGPAYNPSQWKPLPAPPARAAMKGNGK